MKTQAALSDDRATSPALPHDLATLGAAAAGVAGAVALASGMIHGFGKDDEAMAGAVHIALGHALPAVALAAAASWLAALWALRRADGDQRGTLWFSTALLGLVLWASVSMTHAVGPYAVFQVNRAVGIATMKSSSGLQGAFFAAGLLSFVVGMIGFLSGAARRRFVPGPAVALVVLGGLGTFFIGPVGGLLLALGLAWSAVRLRSV